jgi:capsular exopolysaccharide synthesis family protein
MSRIQNILEKAEREGSVRRVRPLDAAGPAPVGYEAPVPSAPLGDTYKTAVAEPVAPGRVVREARLDPILVAAQKPTGVAAEQYRALRTRVAHTNHGSAVDVILVTSPGRREGKSLTAANLALTMAQDFQTRICIVDADMRHSSQHTLFGVEERPGLADVLTGEVALADALIAFEQQQITLLPAGRESAHPAELLGSTAMRRTIESLRSQFDRVIIDAPAAGPLADVGILAPLVDSVLLVVQAGVTTKPAIGEAVSTIGSSRLLGVVLNGSAD